MATKTREEKPCVVCGRRIEWRKKWERDWESVKYCSAACRRAKVGDEEKRLETAIVEMLRGRAKDATICPSEVARAVGGEGWRALMEPVRSAARRLVAAGKIVMMQGGREVDPSAARGAVRLGRPGARRGAGGADQR